MMLPIKRVILALDFDGVLHPECCAPEFRFVHRERFEAVMREVPDVDIVISSQWRVDHPVDFLRTLFAADIALRIVDATPNLYYPGAEYTTGLRQREVELWMRHRAPVGAHWLALDDRPSLFKPDCPHLLAVNHTDEGGIGLQPEHLEELEARLKRLVALPAAIAASTSTRHNSKMPP